MAVVGSWRGIPVAPRGYVLYERLCALLKIGSRRGLTRLSLHSLACSASWPLP